MSQGLRVKNLVVARAGKEVIRDVTIDVSPGQITSLLGANGAGKSSIVLAIAGALQVSSGSVSIDGKSIAGLRPEIIRQLGVAAVPEGHHLLNDLSVADNLRVAGHNLSRQARDAGVEAALDTFPELRAKLNARAGSLSGGQQQMVVLGQAIVHTPRYLLADELSFGLAPVVVARLVPVLQALAKRGMGILLIEQFTQIALRVSEKIYVIDRGQIRFSGMPHELRDNPNILYSAYLASTP
jgi:branched-chain amino acid transport system ATP-binding protein